MPRGTVDRRFRGNSCGRGANLTLRVGNEEEEEDVEHVVVGGFDGSSILRVKGHLVGCESGDSTSSAMDFVRLLR